MKTLMLIFSLFLSLNTQAHSNWYGYALLNGPQREDRLMDENKILGFCAFQTAQERPLCSPIMIVTRDFPQKCKLWAQRHQLAMGTLGQSKSLSLQKLQNKQALFCQEILD